MTHRPIFFTLALILITLSFGAQTLSATTDPITFASFSQKDGTLPFVLTNNNLQITEDNRVRFNSSQVPIVFRTSEGTSIDAYLWLESTTYAAASRQFGLVNQPFNATTTITIQSEADYGLHNSNYLLVATYLEGDMVGTRSSTAEFNSTLVTYTSHYANFSGASNGELHLNFDNLTPAYQINTGNGLVASFAGSGAGSFAASFNSPQQPGSFTPEPQTYALFATCFAVLGWKVRHNRRTSKQNEARLQSDKG